MATNYDYEEDLKMDISYYLAGNNIVLNNYNYDKIYGDMFVDDGVTGNSSGSYTFNREEAKEYVLSNLKLCKEACEEFGISSSEFGNKIYNEEFEELDVIIRCYLLDVILPEFITD